MKMLLWLDNFQMPSLGMSGQVLDFVIQKCAQFLSPVISFTFLLSLGKLFQQAAAQRPGMQFAHLLETFLQILSLFLGVLPFITRR